MSKSELAQKYGISMSTLKVLMNKRYFKDLEAVGYQKTHQLLSPNVVRKFMELYGEPIKPDEL